MEAKFGHVTILINNAGVVFPNSFMNSDPEQIETTLRTNTLAHFWVNFVNVDYIRKEPCLFPMMYGKGSEDPIKWVNCGEAKILLDK